MLIDNFSRKIDYLRLSVTDRCNLRCFYCMPKKGVKLINRRELLTFEEIKRVVKIFTELGIKKVRITGGEPLIRENVLDLIKSITEIKGIEDISLTTNGILLNKYLVQLYDLGVKRINISLDSLDPHKYRMITGGGNIKKVMSSISNAIKIGINPVKINTVLTNFLDEDDISRFIKLSIEKPVSIRFIEMMPTIILDDVECGRIRTTGNGAIITISKILSIMKKIGSYYKMEEYIGYGPAFYYKLAGSKGSVGFIINNKDYCRYCNRIRLTPKGTVRLCLFSDDEFNIKAKIRSGVSDSIIKGELIKFVKTKPESRIHCAKLNNRNNTEIPDYMNQIGG